jgi:anti-sigma B factor antagonist
VFSTDPSIRSYDGRSVVALCGELDLVDAAAAAAAVAFAAVAAREQRIIVDLAGLDFIDYSGVAALARGRRQAWRAGGDLVLAAPQQKVTRVLAVTRLTDAFSVYATVEEAAGEAGHPRKRALHVAV